MANTLLPWPRARFFTADGLPLVGGKVYTYDAGTSTPRPTYTDSTGGSLNTNPVILDAAGEADIWIDGSYKVVLTDADDVQQWEVDGISTSTQSIYSATLISGTGNDILVLTTVPGNFAYDFGTTLTFVAVDANTGPVTINVNGLGVRDIKKRTPLGLEDLQPGDISPDNVFYLFYDGTQFQAVNLVYQPTAVEYGSNFVASVGDFLINHVSTAPITITLPPSNLFPNYYNFAINALGGAVTLDPDAADSIQGEAAGTNFIIPQGSSALLSTNAAGDWYLNYYYAPYVPPVIPPTWNAITGFLPSSIAGTNTTASLTVSAGQSADSTNSVYVEKASTTSWAVSNGNAINGYQGGSTLPNNSTIHFFICSGGSGVGTFASTSLTPSLPTGYSTSFRRIFSLRTGAGGALIPVNSIEAEGGCLINYLQTQTLDVSTTGLGTTRALYPLNVPTNIKVEPFFRVNTSSNQGVIITAGDETDAAPAAYALTGWTAVPGWDMSFNNGSTNHNMPYTTGLITTNTSGEIGARSTGASTNLYLVTRGWKDYRR